MKNSPPFSFFHRAYLHDNRVGALWRLVGFLEKEARLKRLLLPCRSPSEKKSYIPATDAVCLGDRRWNGISEFSQGLLRTGADKKSLEAGVNLNYGCHGNPASNLHTLPIAFPTAPLPRTSPPPPSPFVLKLKQALLG